MTMVPQADGKLVVATALLDEHWSFHNVLSRSLPPLPPVARDDNLRMPGADPRPSKLLNRKLQRSCTPFEGHSKYYSSPQSMSPEHSTRRNQWVQDIKIEVQGCKDLGFVFGKEGGGMDPRLERVIPSIRGRSPAAGVDEKVSPPYLVESCLVNRPAPPPTVRWREGGASAEDDIKEQLRLWARAVACNVCAHTRL